MPVSLFTDPNFVQNVHILGTFVTILTILAGVIKLLGLLFGAGKAISIFNEGLLVLGGMAIIIVSFAIIHGFDLINIYTLISILAFSPLYAYKAYLKGISIAKIIKAFVIAIIAIFFIIVLSIIYK